MSHRFEVAPGKNALLDRLGWHDVDSVLACESGQVVAESRTSSTVRISLADGGSVFLKRYAYPRLHLRHCVRPSRALREWRSLGLLDEIGVPVPEPVVWGEERRGFRLLHSFLVTAGVAGGESLGELLEAGQPVRVSMLRQVADLVARMHDHGFRHRDLYLRNIILGREGRDRGRLFLIDAGKGGMAQDLDSAISDLATLDQDARAWFPEPVRTLFLARYLSARSPGSVPDVATMGPFVTARCERLVETDRRRELRRSYRRQSRR